MKKIGVFALLSLLIISSMFSLLVQAQEPPPLPPEVRGLTEFGERTTKGGNLSYIMKGWGEILRDNEFTGPLIESFDVMRPFFRPIWTVFKPIFNFFFKYTIGLTFSWTWMFFLTLIIWIVLAVYIFRVFNLISIFSKWMHYLIAICLVVIMSLLGITRKIAEFIIKTVSLFDTWWMQLIGVVIVIAILIVAIAFSKNLLQLFRALKGKHEKNKEELDRLKLKGAVEAATSFSREILKS